MSKHQVHRPRAILTNTQVQEIRKLFWTEGMCQQCLAILYKISSGAIHDAVHYKTFWDVPDTFITKDILPKRRAKYYGHRNIYFDS